MTTTPNPSTLSYGVLSDLCDGRLGRFDVACPLCGPGRHSPSNRKRRVLRMWHNESGFASFHCVRCGERGSASNGGRICGANNLRWLRREANDRDRIHAEHQLGKAQWLWNRRRPVEGSPAETYLREVRGYAGPLPATLGFLPAMKQEHHPALVADFGIPSELSPGSLEPNAIEGIHLTLLKPDGSGKAGTGRDKIMLGPSNGWPIVLAGMNDILGLAICEGIETGLSIHEATGLGVWAAGSASRMAALADKIPSYVDCVTIVGEADEAGQAGARVLSQRIKERGLHHELRVLGEEARAA